MEDCIFCKIAHKEIPAEFLYENELVCAFKDLNPQAPFHVLIIPKKHFENVIDAVDAQTLKACVDAAATLKEKFELNTGFRLLTNAGDDAGQTVHHLHFHMLGRARLTDNCGAAACAK